MSTVRITYIEQIVAANKRSKLYHFRVILGVQNVISAKIQ